MIDSTGKYPNGVFQGSLVDLGGYDECVETVIYDEYGNEDIRGQYCNMYVKMKNDTSLFDHIAPLINITNRRVRKSNMVFFCMLFLRRIRTHRPSYFIDMR